MWTESTSPIVIAHRGDKVHAPENTLSAFKLAAEKGADAVEFDVKLTADGQVIVLHDQTVDRTTNGSGNVAKLPLAALRELDAGAWFSGQFRDEKIPTLDDVFEHPLPRHSVPWAGPGGKSRPATATLAGGCGGAGSMPGSSRFRPNEKRWC